MEAFKRKWTDVLHLCLSLGACSRKSRGRTKGIVIGAAACGSTIVIIAFGSVLVCLYRKKLMARRKYNGTGLSLAKS